MNWFKTKLISSIVLLSLGIATSEIYGQQQFYGDPIVESAQTNFQTADELNHPGSRRFDKDSTRSSQMTEVFFPNPLTTKSKLLYRSKEDSKTKFFLFDKYSRITIYREDQCLKGVNAITVSRQNLKEGLYYYILWIAEENKTITGQLTVM